MANDKLSEQSMDFAVEIINLVKRLKEQRESIISNQIGRSGTSIGANIYLDFRLPFGIIVLPNRKEFLYGIRTGTLFSYRQKAILYCKTLCVVI